MNNSSLKYQLYHPKNRVQNQLYPIVFLASAGLLKHLDNWRHCRAVKSKHSESAPSEALANQNKDNLILYAGCFENRMERVFKYLIVFNEAMFILGDILDERLNFFFVNEIVLDFEKFCFETNWNDSDYMP